MNRSEEKEFSKRGLQDVSRIMHSAHFDTKQKEDASKYLHLLYLPYIVFGNEWSILKGGKFPEKI